MKIALPSNSVTNMSYENEKYSIINVIQKCQKNKNLNVKKISFINVISFEESFQFSSCFYLLCYKTKDLIKRQDWQPKVFTQLFLS